jgi:hypothetical protein
VSEGDTTERLRATHREVRGDECGLPALYTALEECRARNGAAALAVAVEDGELGLQVFAVGTDTGAVIAACVAEAGPAWAAAPDVEIASSEIALLSALAGTALRLGAVDPGADPATGLEVAVRSTPGVHAVTRTGGVLRVAADPDARDAVAAALADLAGSGSDTIVVLDGADTRDTTDFGGADDAMRRPRVVLVSVHSRPETGELEVHLAHHEHRTVGRGSLARAGAAAADATLDALRELGEAHGHRVAWVRTVDTLPDRRFLVAVSLTRAQDTPVYGIASGTSPIEAAARATLAACNRDIGYAHDDPIDD